MRAAPNKQSEKYEFLSSNPVSSPQETLYGFLWENQIRAEK